MPSDIIVYTAANAGLGNRLRGMIGYAALARFWSVPFYTVWSRDYQCDIDLKQLFSSIPGVEVDIEKAACLMNNYNALLVHHSDWPDDIWSDYCSESISWVQFMENVIIEKQKFVVSHHYQKSVDSVFREWGVNQYIGIHIRASDNIEHYNFWSKHSRAEFDRSKISNENVFVRLAMRITKDRPLLLATDNPTIQKRLQVACGESIRYLRKRYIAGIPGVRRSTSMEDSFMEFLLLGKCNRIYGTYFSSFARMAAFLFNVEYWEVQGKAIVRDPVAPSRAHLF